MRSLLRIHVVMACVLVGTFGCDSKPNPPQGPPIEAASDEQTLKDFSERVAAYAELHTKMEATIPKLSNEATPAEIDATQRDLLRLIAATRVKATRGELFTPAMEALVRKHLGRVFGGPDGAALKASVMDENPVDITVAVNQRYPDNVPMSTMPPEVLQILPKMPEEIEYRFVGRHLVIVDVHAHLIADYVTNVIPS